MTFCEIIKQAVGNFMSPGPRMTLGPVALALLTLAASLLSAAKAETPMDRAPALADHIELTVPDGDGRHPLAILLPGCLGWQPHHAAWRTRLVADGYAVLDIDSFSARGLAGPATLEREVCSGMQVRGDVRAGDLMAVLHTLIERPDLDIGRSIVFGWSHGGWSAFEFLMRLAGGLTPPDLDRIPDLDGYVFKAAFLFYPYCGPGSLSGADGYPAMTRTLLFHGARDLITDPRQCRARVKALAASGADIEFISLNKAAHWFDNQAEPATYDAGATMRARSAIDAVLNTLQDAAARPR